MSDNEDPTRKPRRAASIMGDDERVAAGAVHRRTPPRGIEIFDAEERTGVHTDVQVFRAVKKLGTRVEAIGDHVKSIDAKLDRVAEEGANVAGQVKVLADDRRNKSPSSLIRAVQETTTVTLAERVLDDQHDEKKFRRRLILKLVSIGGLGGGAGALIHWLFERVTR